jgi:hypothetical protein
VLTLEARKKPSTAGRETGASGLADHARGDNISLHDPESSEVLFCVRSCYAPTPLARCLPIHCQQSILQSSAQRGQRTSHRRYTPQPEIGQLSTRHFQEPRLIASIVYFQQPTTLLSHLKGNVQAGVSNIAAIVPDSVGHSTEGSTVPTSLANFPLEALSRLVEGKHCFRPDGQRRWRRRGRIYGI